MAQTEDERRGYQRGYNRAVSRNHDRVKRVLEIARGYKDARDGANNARCHSCDRWARGGAMCLWGYCRADFEWIAGEGKMWTDPNDAKIVTHETFGCINWVRRNEPNASGGNH